MKTLGSIESKTQSEKGKVKVGCDNRAGHKGSKLDESEFDNGEVDGGEVRDDEIGKKGRKTSKSKNLF